MLLCGIAPFADTLTPIVHCLSLHFSTCHPDPSIAWRQFVLRAICQEPNGAGRTTASSTLMPPAGAGGRRRRRAGNLPEPPWSLTTARPRSACPRRPSFVTPRICPRHPARWRQCCWPPSRCPFGQHDHLGRVAAIVRQAIHSIDERHHDREQRHHQGEIESLALGRAEYTKGGIECQDNIRTRFWVCLSDQIFHRIPSLDWVSLQDPQPVFLNFSMLISMWPENCWAQKVAIGESFMQ